MINGICMQKICKTKKKEEKWSWNSIGNLDVFPVGLEDIVNERKTLPTAVAVFPQAPDRPSPKQGIRILMNNTVLLTAKWWRHMYAQHNGIKIKMTEMLKLRKQKYFKKSYGVVKVGIINSNEGEQENHIRVNI